MAAGEMYYNTSNNRLYYRDANDTLRYAAFILTSTRSGQPVGSLHIDSTSLMYQITSTSARAAMGTNLGQSALAPGTMYVSGAYLYFVDNYPPASGGPLLRRIGGSLG